MFTWPLLVLEKIAQDLHTNMRLTVRQLQTRRRVDRLPFLNLLTPGMYHPPTDIDPAMSFWAWKTTVPYKWLILRIFVWGMVLLIYLLIYLYIDISILIYLYWYIYIDISMNNNTSIYLLISSRFYSPNNHPTGWTPPFTAMATKPAGPCGQAWDDTEDADLWENIRGPPPGQLHGTKTTMDRWRVSQLAKFDSRRVHGGTFRIHVKCMNWVWNFGAVVILTGYVWILLAFKVTTLLSISLIFCKMDTIFCHLAEG